MIVQLALLGNSKDLYVRTMYSQLLKHLHYDLYIHFSLGVNCCTGASLGNPLEGVGSGQEKNTSVAFSN